jgi:E3 ubiquitin-protein ligase DOA10
MDVTALDPDYDDVCRICFGAGCAQFPLLRACDCDGTQAFIHVYCLTRAAKSQMDHRQSNLRCRICEGVWSQREFDTVVTDAETGEDLMVRTTPMVILPISVQSIVYRL